MKVGIPREVKNHEYRVAITPPACTSWSATGTRCSSRRTPASGRPSRTSSSWRPGAKILDTADDVWATGDMVLKVKEPVAEEYHRMRKDQVLFTYLHLAADQPCTDALLGRRDDRHRLRDRAAAGRLAAAARADVRGRRPARAAGRLVPPDAPGRRPRHADGRRPRRVRGEGRRHRRRASRARTPRRSRSACRPRCCCSTATSRGCGRWTRSTRATARRSRRTPTRSSARCSTPTSSSARCSCRVPRRRRSSATSSCRA